MQQHAHNAKTKINQVHPSTTRAIMNLPTCSVQDAKARFSGLLDICVTQGPQMVTKRQTKPRVNWCCLSVVLTSTDHQWLGNKPRICSTPMWFPSCADPSPMVRLWQALGLVCLNPFNFKSV